MSYSFYTYYIYTHYITLLYILVPESVSLKLHLGRGVPFVQPMVGWTPLEVNAMQPLGEKMLRFSTPPMSSVQTCSKPWLVDDMELYYPIYWYILGITIIQERGIPTNHKMCNGMTEGFWTPLLWKLHMFLEKTVIFHSFNGQLNLT